MINFGSGKLWAVPSDGSTPVQFGILQDVSVNFSFDKKELYGAKQFPVRVVRGKGKVEAKAAFAEIDATAINLLLSGTKTTGEKNVTTTTANIPAVTPFTITGEAGADNLGVYNVAGTDAVAMKLVTSAPATGEYSYDKTTGVYTFAEADAGKKVQYSIMTAETTGSTITITNNMMGVSPQFKTVLNGSLAGKQITLTLNACMSDKLDMAFKQEDFLIPSFDISAFADAADEIGTLTISA